jgi:uncharacterized short protein YbdD (DUF466 family)
MKAAARNVPAVAPTADDAGGAPRSGLRAYAHSLRQGCRQVFGIPDYDRYVAHMAVQHPGEPPLSRRDFFAQSIDRKYGKSGPRCC